MTGSSSAPRVEFSVYTNNGGPTLAEPEVFEAVAQAADDLAYDAIAVYDHVVMPGQLQDAHPYGGHGHFTAESRETYFDPLITLAYLAARTRRVKLLTSAIIAPYRPPLLAAKMLASLDALSRGRLILGVGVGWSRGEFDALGVPFEHRGRLTDEALRIWNTLWTEDRPSYQGRYHSFENVLFRPKPVQRPRPPLWIGGHSPAALRRAVRSGDGWHATRVTVAELARLLGDLRAIAQEEGRDPAELTIVLKLNLRFRRPAATAADLAGTPEEIIERLEAYKQLGVSHFVLDVAGDEGLEPVLSAMHAFAETVRPHVTA